MDYSPESSNIKYEEVNHSDNRPRRNQFLSSLLDALENQENSNAICWDSTGTLVVLKDQTLISEQVLPRYFCGMKFSSFIRQLNYYGFKRTSRRAKTKIYYHDQFQKGRRDLMKKIKRNQRDIPVEEKSEELSEPEHHKEKDNEKTIEKMNKKLKYIQAELESLRQENTILRSWVKKISRTATHNRNQFSTDDVEFRQKGLPEEDYHTPITPQYQDYIGNEGYSRELYDDLLQLQMPKSKFYQPEYFENESRYIDYILELNGKLYNHTEDFRPPHDEISWKVEDVAPEDL